MLLRIFSTLIILSGLSFAGYSGWHWWQETNLVKEYDDKYSASANEEEKLLKPLDKGIKYKKKIKIGQSIGDLIIPRIKARVPLVEGIGTNELAKGVGHYPGGGMVFPGETGHSVLAGHRETTFKKMGKIKKGDYLIVNNDEGTFTYKVQKMWIVKANNHTVIVSKKKPTLTLITCYPFRMFGNSPQRYIVQSQLVKIEKPGEKKS
ncbi:sortase A [Marininema mesophilum]|uniref:Sortase A n=1 Tax=Marininema mesophilum TaxID=1048340 RepID=A0A1H2X5I2_9BACL|nr:sortase [Marininema mesophilum]SDW88140.1 sortase A [Marininema mesophilum]